MTRAQARSSGARFTSIALAAAQLLVIAALSATCWVIVQHVPFPPFKGLFDLRVYQGAVQWWTDGRPLYEYSFAGGPYGFTYPPFAALLMTPLAAVGFHLAAVVHTTVNVVLAVAAAAWLMVPIARRAGWSPWFVAGLAAPVVLLMEPVRETLGFGQVNLMLGALIVADLVALQRGWRWAGIGIGLATAVKLTPGVFVLYLVVTRQWRTAATAVGAAAVATLASFAVDADTSREFWTHTLWNSSRVGELDQISNQSLQGLLARIELPAQPDQRVWAVAALVVLVIGLVRARAAHRSGDELVAFTLVGLLGCLISPISWTHHLYWFVPAVAVLLDVAAGAPVSARAAALLGQSARQVGQLAGGAAVLVVAVLCGGTLWHFGVPGPFQPHPTDLAGQLGENTYVLLMLALLLLLPVRSRDRFAHELVVRTPGSSAAEVDRQPGVPTADQRDQADRATPVS